MMETIKIAEPIMLSLCVGHILTAELVDRFLRNLVQSVGRWKTPQCYLIYQN